MTLYFLFCERLNFLHNVYYLIFYNETDKGLRLFTYLRLEYCCVSQPVRTRSDSSPEFVEYKGMDPQKIP